MNDKEHESRREYALGRAAQAWCTKETSGKVVDPVLAQAFADILVEEMEKITKSMEEPK